MAATLPPAALSDPYAIFARVRRYWETARYPKQVSYDVVAKVTREGGVSAAHYHCYYDALADKVHVSPVSDEELAHPYTPHGINFGFNVLGGSVPLSSQQHTFDYLGVPVLAPNFSFGIAEYAPGAAAQDPLALVNQIRREFNEGPKILTSPAPAGNLPTIASVEAVKRRYYISLGGIVALTGHSDYDLVLRPVTDPGRYRLREIWADTATFATDKIATQGNFTQDGLTRVPWTVSFKQIGGAPFIASESTPSAFQLARRSYDSASVTFENIAPARIPFTARYAAFISNEMTGMPPLVEP